MKKRRKEKTTAMIKWKRQQSIKQHAMKMTTMTRKSYSNRTREDTLSNKCQTVKWQENTKRQPNKYWNKKLETLND